MQPPRLIDNRSPPRRGGNQVMNHEQFQKNYAYSFRHMYGKEGSRKNYTAFSCMKIIMGTPTHQPPAHAIASLHSTPLPR
jgi:hypothetical protein